MALGKIEAVAVHGPARLEIGWDDGQRMAVDLAGIVAALAPLAPLRDAAEFSRVAISSDGWSLEWPSGVDFGAPQLRRWADEQAGEIMAASAFRAWIDKHAMTLEKAADALGLSRRMVAYYLSGEKAIPKTVMLATMGFEANEAV